MISLESPEWAKLSHAYGNAEDIPGLLLQLQALPIHDGPAAEPYFSLWSALCHQGDAYSASYAGVPHIVSAIAVEPTRAHWSLFLLVASIEIARCTGHAPALADNLREPYEAAMQSIPRLVGEAAATSWDHWHCGAALACIAVAKGHIELGQAILELNSATLNEFLTRVRGVSG